MIGLIGLGIAIFILSYFGVLAIRYLAERHEILDIPNERSSHTRSVPRGAGLAIAILTLAGIWFYASFNPLVERRPLLAYTIGAVLIAGISWLDDLASQPSWLRFTIHGLGAVLAIYGFGYLRVGGLIGLNASWSLWLGFTITFLWIVGLTNAYNFMDGIDGIAGGQAVVGGLCWAVAGWVAGQPFMVAMGLVLAASSLGFLFHNWSPARIFIGDVGSAFLGYTFAVLPFIFVSRSEGPHGLWVILAGILPLWPFIFDSTFTFLRRLSRRERVFSAHRSHLYQRLVIAGHSHKFVSLLYIALAIPGAGLAIGAIAGLRNFSFVITIVLPLLCLALWVFVIRMELTWEKRLRSNLKTYADPA